MERKLYTDSFERMLKEKSDEFRMYPSKKVWHSIYNNIYPGKKWPSAIIGLVCLTALFLISYLNNSASLKQHNFNSQYSSVQNFSFTANSLPIQTIAADFSNSDKKDIAAKRISYDDITVKENGEHVHVFNKMIIPKKDLITEDHNLIQADYISSSSASDNVTRKNTPTEKQSRRTSGKVNEYIQRDLLKAYTLSNEQEKKWTDKLSLQVYASPSIVYGTLSGGKMNAADDNNQFNENPSLGLEAGTAMQYALSEGLKLKAGVQFNYASYNLEAYQNDRPSLLSSDPTTNAYNITSRASLYSMNDPSLPVTFHNETYQLSLPVGLELKLLKNRNLQWNAGATIQPTFIAGGNAYMLSSDNRNYVDASSALNRWNLNAGFETFVTYKINGIVWQLGPQIRYQFLSIYGKGYTGVDEKLANYGVKIGISKAIH